MVILKVCLIGNLKPHVKLSGWSLSVIAEKGQPDPNAGQDIPAF